MSVMEGSFPRRGVGVSMIGIMLTTKSWKSSPLKICRNFDRTLACAACLWFMSITDVHRRAFGEQPNSSASDRQH